MNLGYWEEKCAVVGALRIVAHHDGAGCRRPAIISFGKLPKAPEKFRRAFQIVPKTINPLPISSENFACKPILIKALRPNLSAERLKISP